MVGDIFFCQLARLKAETHRSEQGHIARKSKHLAGVKADGSFYQKI